MEIIASAAVSVDGCLDDAGPRRLVLSGPEDWADVLALRARCDAVLVGAGTIRADDPSLATRSPDLAAARQAAGQPEHPVKVTITRSGDVAPTARFFRDGDGAKLVFCPPATAAGLAGRLAGLATIVPLPAAAPALPALVAYLERLGMTRLLVEGGREILTAFLAHGLVDELRLAIAPVFVGDPRAPRFPAPAAFPHGPDRRMAVDNVRVLGDMVVIRYRLHRTPRP